jgi:curved DNA-binding protein
MQPLRNHYQSLGLSPQADAATIKRAYRRLARRHHPDVNEAAGAQQVMAQLNEAYQVLSDPRLRAAYDAVRLSQVRQPARPVRGSDAHAKLAIDLVDAYSGALRDINLQPPGAMEPRHLKVMIPRCVRPGQVLCIPGQGGEGSGGGAAGDLFLEIQFKTDSPFRVDGLDVQGTLKLAPWQAALGAEVAVSTPDGYVVRVVVPADSPNGRILRLAGLGLPGEPAGDLLLALQIVLPPSDDPKTRALWEVMAQALPDFKPHEEPGQPG